jgi:hypothetical protein
VESNEFKLTTVGYGQASIELPVVPSTKKDGTQQLKRKSMLINPPHPYAGPDIIADFAGDTTLIRIEIIFGVSDIGLLEEEARKAGVFEEEE